ncbi:MAG TPA: hypothetical protein VEK11_07565 [Thermoanaerobaculia bacterium]|nr:hypothetical protein [Thermoanaerobaculia bacterium]
MRITIVVALVLLAACRGEPVPRDYQNAPPDMTNAPQSQTATPAQHGMGDAPPQPSTGNEGPNPKATTGTETTGTLPDTPPVSTTT